MRFEKKKPQCKKGIGLGEAFGAVLMLILVAVLVIVGIYLFVTLSSNTTLFPAGSAQANATNVMIAQFGTYPALVGLVGTIIFLGIVIGVLVGSFVFQPTRRA